MPRPVDDAHSAPSDFPLDVVPGDIGWRRWLRYRAWPDIPPGRESLNPGDECFCKGIDLCLFNTRRACGEVFQSTLTRGTAIDVILDRSLVGAVQGALKQ